MNEKNLSNAKAAERMRARRKKLKEEGGEKLEEYKKKVKKDNEKLCKKRTMLSNKLENYEEVIKSLNRGFQ
jgi:ribosome-binding protein aMBF1 (putative translation factor)